MSNRSINVALIITLLAFFACKKDRGANPIVTPGGGSLQSKSIYTDSVFYIQEADIKIKPSVTQTGIYNSIPEGLKLDQNTGEIDVNKSETGLKYRVSFTSQTGEVQTSTIIISGINYEDKIYNLSKGDSIAVPIYNANTSLNLPGADNFDENGGCKKAGIVVNPTDAKINLALSVRNQGIDTGATQEVKLVYRLNDNSNKALNGINVKIYFYRTSSEIPQYLTDLIAERKNTILSTNAPHNIQRLTTQAFATQTTSGKTSRPRPPCIIVVSR